MYDSLDDRLRNGPVDVVLRCFWLEQVVVRKRKVADSMRPWRDIHAYWMRRLEDTSYVRRIHTGMLIANFLSCLLLLAWLRS